MKYYRVEVVEVVGIKGSGGRSERVLLSGNRAVEHTTHCVRGCDFVEKASQLESILPRFCESPEEAGRRVEIGVWHTRVQIATKTGAGRTAVKKESIR
jgi:hypothetical protein